MKHTMIDTSQMELTDKVVAIKRVTKVVKGGRHQACYQGRQGRPQHALHGPRSCR